MMVLLFCRPCTVSSLKQVDGVSEAKSSMLIPLLKTIASFCELHNLKVSHVHNWDRHSTIINHKLILHDHNNWPHYVFLNVFSQILLPTTWQTTHWLVFVQGVQQCLKLLSVVQVDSSTLASAPGPESVRGAVTGRSSLPNSIAITYRLFQEEGKSMVREPCLVLATWNGRLVLFISLGDRILFTMSYH